MNKTLQEGIALAKELNEALANEKPNCDVIICTPFIHLASVTPLVDAAKIGVGAENCADKASGAYTGEVSAEMVASTGAKYVILGHSERRAYYGETVAILEEKVKLALANGLTPIFCIGEVLEEREANKQNEVVAAQMESVFSLSAEDFSKIVLAYEPVWAIGTGKTASPEQAQEIHAFIRSIVANKYGKEIADNTSILYGGSCKPSNAKELFSNPDVDGGEFGSGTWGEPLEGEELVPFEQYILGVAYQEIGPSAPDEAIKAQMVAARSYALARPTAMGNALGKKLEQESDGKWILQMASCVADQVYCNPNLGCSAMNDGEQYGTVRSGIDHGTKFKDPMPADHKMRTLANETMGEVLKSILVTMGVRIKNVERSEYRKPIGELAGIRKEEKEAESYEGEELPEEMMIMCGFTQSMIQELLIRIRRQRMAPVDLKAVLTPTNQNWNSLEIYEEIKKEHRMMHEKTQAD